MSKSLSIAITADPLIPVPPVLYGGIERIIDMLIKGYIEKGHKVTLFAHSDSQTGAEQFSYKGKSDNTIDAVRNALLINKTVYSGKFDILHSFGRLAYLIPLFPLPLPIIMSYQREPTLTQIRRASKISASKTLVFTGCSDYITKQISPYAPAFTIYNGVDIKKYEFIYHVEEDAPLAFLGRLEPIKGAHNAINVAKKTSKKLIIAGNIVPEFESYFREKIEPHLNDRITYIGAVDDEQKNTLLGKCAALLMPIEWDEPFGIVMIEAMACGTPVIGFNRGAAPEVIIHGHNGFICTDFNEMAGYISKIATINRTLVRSDVEERFSSDTIINKYLDLYYQLIPQ